MIKRQVDDHLPKWLSSKMLSAVDFIWRVKGDDEETCKRITEVSKVLDGEQMCWVMMLLTLPKINDIVMDSDEAREFKAHRLAERTLH